ncbi:hypothetical protein NON00_13880 [Roseomonas sp. GC11]|uniref:hypothetical protein n=1 Tax=Roseomonas sp. GC11 TaxID=2950546 RepID=UPI00210C7704|nr:hypothetical protein [Roseomonas sp. GC11]MCQ4161010.1 hypothetical protein [Roseomonas sp. GC11]
MSATINGVGQLMCGNQNIDGIAGSALLQLSSSIVQFSDRMVDLLNRDDSVDRIALGPFCTRVFMENSFAAIMARLDSFRIIYLSEFQNQPEYIHGKRAKSSFSWFGDVIPIDEKSTTALWNIEHDSSKISRALFSQYSNHMYWKNAMAKSLDYVSKKPASAIKSEFSLLDPETFMVQYKGTCQGLYSSLSKGVHWEFFTTAMVYDDNTVTDLIKSTAKIVSQFGFISNFISTSISSCSPDEAWEIYCDFRSKTE